MLLNTLVISDNSICFKGLYECMKHESSVWFLVVVVGSSLVARVVLREAISN